MISALWICAGSVGHDAAQLADTARGRRLDGATAFRSDAGEACALAYTLRLDRGWRTLGGTVRGFHGATAVDHAIRRTASGWTFDGAPVGLAHLVDLDFSFTPSTNLQQLRRMALRVGEARELRVAWFNPERGGLTELVQLYERRAADRYWYRAPEEGYEGMLEIAETGFVRVYPDLWALAD